MASLLAFTPAASADGWSASVITGKSIEHTIDEFNCAALSAISYLACAGLSCFQGVTPGGGTGCDGAPLLPVLYVSMNLAYNISLLNLLRSAGTISVAVSVLGFQEQ